MRGLTRFDQNGKGVIARDCLPVIDAFKSLNLINTLAHPSLAAITFDGIRVIAYTSQTLFRFTVPVNCARGAMPADIRSFFGGAARASQGSQKKDEKPAPKKATPKKPARASRVVVDDSDDDDEVEEVK